MTRALLPALLAGCAATTSYIYAPRGASTSQGGYPAAVIGVPPGGPTGQIELVSYGISDVTLPGKDRVGALHVRITLDNERDRAGWTFVPSEQRVELGRQPAAGPILTSPDARSLVVPAGEHRSVDLYYALPPGIFSEDDLPGFELAWRVGAATARTHFERVEDTRMASKMQPLFRRGEEPY